ncbi:Putative inner membrane protein [Bacteroides luti]|uniref:Putative inner membrane protein n=1 Tax=Bacteroides luti TaxID=1297750 RepID=A0A1M5DSV8_9BACE|nr:DUF1819 family protein [Bacteroides luti]SHF70015.1 Putative inner membrane protein [Bacteroides luti]
MVNTKKYSFSFTGASALISETLVIAKEYHKLNDWNTVQISLSDNNHLNKVKQGTFKREFSEIKKRLSLLTPNQLQLMIQGSYEEAKFMILLSLVKAYPYLFDFIVEVLLNKYLLFDRTLLNSDYTRFVNSKSLQHPELEKITEITSKKVKQVVFKLLEQVGLITNIKNGIILKPFLSSQITRVILDDDPVYLSAFLYSNQEIKVLIEKPKDDN